MLCETMFCVLKFTNMASEQFLWFLACTFSDDESRVRNLMICLCMSQRVW